MTNISFIVQVEPLPELEKYIKQMQERFEDPMIDRFMTWKATLKYDMLEMEIRHYLPIMWQFGLLFIVPLPILVYMQIIRDSLLWDTIFSISIVLTFMAWFINKPYFHYLLMKYGARKAGYRGVFKYGTKRSV